MLDNEFYYYRTNQSDLVSKFNGRFLVITGNKVIGDYGSYLEAYVKTKKQHAPGTFLIQECTEGDRAYTVTCHNVISPLRIPVCKPNCHFRYHQ